MRINEYEKFEDFYYEYAYGKAFSWQDPNKKERFRGLEFTYNDEYYRMCNEPLKEEDFPILPNGKKGHYSTMIDKTGHFDWEILGWYENLDDVLDNWIIDGKKFREVIMADETKIEWKD